ncbi:metallophosphoesterase [Bacteroidota bacterium]
MKIISFIIFFSIAIAVYSSINFYIYKRAFAVIPHDSPYRTTLVVIFIFIVLSYIAGRIIERYSITVFSDALIWIGSFWIAFMFYFLLFFLLIDLLRLVNHLTGFFPDFITSNIEKTKQITAIVILSLVTLTVVLGHINTKFPVIRKLNLTINKQVVGIDELRVAVVSDIHLGTIIGKNHARKVVDKINSLNPDIILMPGDIIDEDIAPVLNDNICEELMRLKSKYGVYAVTGNHEYIGGVRAAVEYLGKNKINIISDTSVTIDNKFILVGREDRAISQFTEGKRIPLNKIMMNVDTALPVILMDHQPFGLNEAEANGIDLQLSGHTHHGQLWPLNFITSKIYELSWGYMQKGNTHYYVSCGVGGWGPPIRTVSRPEIVEINLKFD